MTTVLLTGASGFIALHIINVLLTKGYKVIGTVRSQSKADNIAKQFEEEFPNGELSFEIVEDISTKDAFDHVLKAHPEVSKVIHSASPFFYGTDKDSLKQTYLVPATQGTKNILTAIDKYGSAVENVVVTSSFAAIVNRPKIGDSSFIHTEDTWNPMNWEDVDNDNKAYTVSKKAAEQVARDHVKTNNVKYGLTTVNPPFVFGPQKFESSLVNPTLNTSAETINKLLQSDPSDEHFFDTPLGLAVDVRDVALLHVLPLEQDGLNDKRLFPVNGAFNGQTLLNIINSNFKDLSIAKGKPEGADEYVEKNHWFYDTTQTLKWTGLKQWIPLEKTVVDSVSQIISYKKSQEKL